METREALKAKAYARLYEEEAAKQDIFSKLTRQKPKIRSTAEIVGVDHEAVRADVNGSKIFVRTSVAKTALIVQSAPLCIMFLIMMSTAFMQEKMTGSGIFFYCLLGGILLAFAFPNLIRLFNKPAIEIKSSGIRLNKHLYSWKSILDTYIVIRRGRGAEWQLLLLMDNGKIVRMRLNDFFSLQHDATAMNISYYIEHYKRLGERIAAVEEGV